MGWGEGQGDERVVRRWPCACHHDIHSLLRPLSCRFISNASPFFFLQFYEKFSTRAHIGDLFEHLWENPGHRRGRLGLTLRCWVVVAQSASCTGSVGQQRGCDERVAIKYELYVLSCKCAGPRGGSTPTPSRTCTCASAT